MRSENSSQNSSKSGILLLAKQSGETSFSSLTAVKKSLNTGKVGHTGTLDSFADGLLVVLTGSLTRLVPHITNFSKSYTALIEFGTETDTLECTGTVIKTGPIPSRQQVKEALCKFQGQIEQVPRVFSALHVDGKRASDLVREGKTVELKPRKITIHQIELLDFKDKYALVNVNCSKGTYIRSLARDIAAECGTVAHLKSLRRTSVGPFKLENAAGFNQLGNFDIDSLIDAEPHPLIQRRGNSAFEEEILKCTYPMTPEIAEFCGFECAILSRAFVHDFNSGRKLRNHSFYFKKRPSENCDLAVFYPDLDFAGVVKKSKNNFSYGFVIPVRREKIKIYSWEQIINGKFDACFAEQGTALSIGSFDGTHIGHDSIFDSIMSRKEYAGGIVTFRHSTRTMKAGSEYPGDVSSLSQRLEFFIQKGFKFVIVIDFSDDFIKMNGTDFLSVLKNRCNLKYLAEGMDFRCGYKGATDINALKNFCQVNGIQLDVVNFVDYLGKKVGSTRIRQDVLDKQFEAIKIMLRKPYELDCSGYYWSREESEGKIYLTAKKRGTQVFPPDGQYAVTLNMVISGSEEISVIKTAACKLDSGLLRVLDSDGSLRGFIRTIQFS